MENNNQGLVPRPSATTIGELDIHMLNLQMIVSEIRSGMVTKSDIQTLKSDIQTDMDKKFVTNEKFKELEKKVDSATIGSSLMRWAAIVTKLAGAGAALVAFVGMLAAVVHFADAIKALI